MALTRGDIVIVAQGELGRPRPVVIVQVNELDETAPTLLACPITSLLTERLPIRPTAQATPDTGLRVTSQIMTDKLFPARRDRIRRTVGKLDIATLEQVERALLIILGLAR